MLAVASYFTIQKANEACQKLIDAGYTGKWTKAAGRFVILTNASMDTAREVLA